MTGLDSFLDSKWVKKTAKTLNRDKYITNLPSTITKRFNFDFINQMQEDKFLYDYTLAFKINNDSISVSEMKMMEILSMLLIDGNLQLKDPKKLRKKIIAIMDGQKPKDNDENKIWNLLEVLNLIHEEKFEINVNNYELFIHILFRNIHISLDDKKDYYRKNDSPSVFKNLVDESFIDVELLALLKYIEELSKSDLSGYCQIYLVFFAFIFISPYKQYNVIVGLLLVKWLTSKYKPSFVFSLPIYQIAKDWDVFVEQTNKLFVSDFKLDDCFEMIRKFSRARVNMTYRLELLDEWVQKDKHIAQNIFTDVIDKILIVNLLDQKLDEWNLNTVEKNFYIRDTYVLTKKEIEDILQRFIDLKMIVKKETKNSIKYKINNYELEKTRMLLRD